MSNGGNGINNGAGSATGADSSSNAGSGTEYTLQGVMRFLQMEWHNHERARNAWYIERAEMKARIAKQEGEKRRMQKLNDQLDRHVRMLENALKKERAKTQALLADGKLPDNLDHFLWTQTDGKPAPEPKSGTAPAALSAIRSAGKEALQRAVDEIAYLIAPTRDPVLPGELQVPVEQANVPMEDPYFQHLHGQNMPHRTSNGDGPNGEPSQHGMLMNSFSGPESYPPSHGFGSAFLPADKMPPPPPPPSSTTRASDPHPTGRPESWNWDSPSGGQEEQAEDPHTSALSSFPRHIPRSGAKGTHKSRTKSGNGSRRASSGFNIRFELCGHLDVVRSVIFTGGGSHTEPEICTAGDDGVIKRWFVLTNNPTVEVQSFITHRGHEGAVTCLAATNGSPVKTFSHSCNWIFSGGQDGTIRLWDRDRVGPVTTIQDHTDAVWALHVLPATARSVFGDRHPNIEDPDQTLLLASGSADGTVKIWAIGEPHRKAVPSPDDSASNGESTEVGVPINLLHSIQQPGYPSPTCIAPYSPLGRNFIVSYNDASILILNTATGEIMSSMASKETYDNSPATGVNSVVGIPTGHALDGRGDGSGAVHGATGSIGDGGLEGIIISGHEDEFIRIFDANSGQCTYSMHAHPSSISALCLASHRPDVQEVASAGHDGGVRVWDLRKRSCVQEIASHRKMRDEGACGIAWGSNQFDRYLVSVGGDGAVKFYSR